MPVYNAGKYVSECIESILHQTEHDWELLAVNDHSTDDSQILLDVYSHKDDRIHVLQNEGKGIIHALRMAYKNSSGSLITRMDADDIMHEHKLQLLKESLIQKGKGYCVTAKVSYFSDDELGEGYLKYAEWLNQLTVQKLNFSEIYKECVIPSPCWMLFRDDLDRCEAFEPNRYPEDYDLVFRMYEQELKVEGIDHVLHYWRDHSERASRNDDHYKDQAFLDLKIPYFFKLDRDDSRPLILWGAGKKGKELAKRILGMGKEFIWVTNNEKKQNTQIYGQNLSKQGLLDQYPKAQILIAISSPSDLEEVKREMIRRDAIKGLDYFPFY